MLGDPEDDLFALMGRLIERMRRPLALRHLDTDHGKLQVADFIARGRISRRMLMTFEGWQFKLEIHDLGEEV